MIDIQRYQNVAVGDTVADTQTAYEALLATNGVLSNETDLTDVEQKTGTITAVAQAVIDGNSHFYCVIDDEDVLYDFALPGLINILTYQVGDPITFTYLKTEGMNTVYSIIGEDGEKQTVQLDTDSGEDNAAEQAVDEAAVQQAA